MDRRPDPRAILWNNVQALMRHRYGKDNLTRFAEETKLGPGSVSRIKSCKTYVQLDTLEQIAEEFDLAPWQLLVPNMEPGNPPVLREASPAERRLYKRFLAFKKALENGDDEDDFSDTLPGPPR